MLRYILLALVFTAAVGTHIDELVKLNALKKDGAISGDEFEKMKAIILQHFSSRGCTTGVSGEELTHLVERVLVSDKMTTLFASLIDDGIKERLASPDRRQLEADEGGEAEIASASAPQTALWLENQNAKPVEILRNTFFRSNALHCTATARILIPAECSAVS